MTSDILYFQKICLMTSWKFRAPPTSSFKRGLYIPILEIEPKQVLTLFFFSWSWGSFIVSQPSNHLIWPLLPAQTGSSTIQHILMQKLMFFEYEIYIVIIKDDTHLQNTCMIHVSLTSSMIIWLNRKFTRTLCVCSNKHVSAVVVVVYFVLMPLHPELSSLSIPA